jgi:hypothetical protein
MNRPPLVASDFVAGNIYFLVGYLDETCRVPFVQTLIYIKKSSHFESDSSEAIVELVFADAIAWYRAKDSGSQDCNDLLYLNETDLDGIKDISRLAEEIQQLASAGSPPTLPLK